MTPTYTPMIQQYLQVKEKAKDAFLFFRLGDFYEMFFDDAINASRELEITLTGREGGGPERIPMCGVPYHSAENYIARLVDKGYKVAICEQVEEPGASKGVVKREIVRIVTPGTVMDSRSLSENTNNYIACVTGNGYAYGFTACDISTGELYVTELELSVRQLMDELNVYQPSELIAEGSLLEALAPYSKLRDKPMVLTPWASADRKLPDKHFAPAAVGRLSEVQLETVSKLLDYLQETQKRALLHVKHLRVYEPKQFMVMDPFTRRNLELVETVRDRAKKGSLLWLLDRTVTAMGARMLRRWVEKPLIQKAQIDERLEAVERLYNGLILREETRQALKEVYDMERLAGRVSYGSANGRDMLALKMSLSQIPNLVELCMNSGSATLQKLVQELDGCEDVRELIDATIVDEPPVGIRDGGIIKDGYHSYLDQLKEANKNGKQWLAELEKRERDNTGIRTLKIGYNKVFGYFIEVSKANIGSLPEGRYERKQTLANAERYVTQELKEKEALILEAQEKMVDIEYELFLELRDKVAGQISRLQKLAETIATIDVYQSLAAVSAANRYRRPEVTDGYDLAIADGRHPVVEAVMNDGSFIANDTDLASAAGRMLLITGPNMAGKSTYMRQVAIISLMAQIGCFVPAEKAVVPIVDRIFTRIGAADDLIGGQSTFMVEMMDIQIMTEKATPKSLVIIDELGRGTSTGEGMSIAQAVIEYLHDEIGCKTLVSTHFHELAHLEETLPHLRNHCMAVKESGGGVTFLRKLIPGAASTSYGIYCAQIAGLPGGIIDRAYSLLHTFEARSSVAEAAGKAAASVEQLSLFDEVQTPPPAREKKPEKDSELIRSLKDADLINMTPLQAMNLLYELKSKL